MNPIDHQLQRLFRSAARAENPAPEATVPFSTEQRILAAWRQGLGEDHLESVLLLFRRMLIGACLVVLLALAVSYEELSASDDRVPEIATAALQVSIAP